MKPTGMWAPDSSGHRTWLTITTAPVLCCARDACVLLSAGLTCKMPSQVLRSGFEPKQAARVAPPCAGGAAAGTRAGAVTLGASAMAAWAGDVTEGAGLIETGGCARTTGGTAAFVGGLLVCGSGGAASGLEALGRCAGGC